jgi:hypothetical protein
MSAGSAVMARLRTMISRGPAWRYPLVAFPADMRGRFSSSSSEMFGLHAQRVGLDLELFHAAADGEHFGDALDALQPARDDHSA